MRKKQIQTLTLMAILTALSIVLKKFSIDTGLFRISLFDTPIIIAGMIAGPLWGVLVGFYSDLIYGLISGYQFSFIMMLSALVWGLCGGVLYKKKPKYLVLLLAVLISSVITTTINSLQLYIWYGGGMFADLPQRIVTMLIKWPITTTVVYILFKNLKKYIIKGSVNN